MKTRFTFLVALVDDELTSTSMQKKPYVLTKSQKSKINKCNQERNFENNWKKLVTIC